MLTTTELRRKALPAKENLAKLREENYNAGEHYRLSDQLELKNAAKRTGEQLFHTELIRRIEKITHRRVFAEDSRADKNVCGFYTSAVDKATGATVKRFICAFDKGPLPEFSIITTDARDLPIKEKRGWRTVLTRLMQAKVITWPQVVYGFGSGDGQASDRWNFNTRDARAR